MESEGNNSEVLRLLNESLQIEYSFIINYPQIASRIRDENIRKDVLNLGTASMKHADTVSAAIVSLEGEPEWRFALLEDGISNTEIFTAQLEKEKQALELHNRCTALVTDNKLKDNLAIVAKDEEWHIKLVEKILKGFAGNSSLS